MNGYELQLLGEKTSSYVPKGIRQSQAELDEICQQMKTTSDLLYAFDSSQCESICLTGLAISVRQWAERLREIEFRLCGQDEDT